MTDHQTRDRVLSAALRVFADRGYEKATLAEITRTASANIASVNYYFRSKSDLFLNVIDNFFGPFNTVRIRSVEDCLATLDDQPDRLGALIEAIVMPLVDLTRNEAEGRAMLRLMMQMRSQPLIDLTPMVARAFDPVHETVVRALSRVLPDLGRTELVWRYDMARGGILHALADPMQLERRIADENRVTRDIGRQMIVSFVRGGLASPPAVQG